MDLATALDRLVAEGKRTGHLTLGQITAVLPVEEMDTLALAQVIARLEAAGIEVDIDPELAAGRLGAGEAGNPVVDVLPDLVPPPTPSAPGSPSPGDRDRSDGAAAPPEPRGPLPRRPWNFWTVMAALAVVLVVALGVAVLARA